MTVTGWLISPSLFMEYRTLHIRWDSPHFDITFGSPPPSSQPTGRVYRRSRQLPNIEQSQGCPMGTQMYLAQTSCSLWNRSTSRAPCIPAQRLGPTQEITPRVTIASLERPLCHPSVHTYCPESWQNWSMESPYSCSNCRSIYSWGWPGDKRNGGLSSTLPTI